MRQRPAFVLPFKHLISLVIFSAILAAASGPAFDVSAAPLTATSPTLGAAASYSVIAGSAVTNTGPTHMEGDLGISPGIGPKPHYTGLNTSNVGPPGAIHDADVAAAAAQAADTAAFTALDQGCTTTYPGVKDLGGLSLVAGVYCADAFLLTGNLTLSGTGVWIFKSAATLTTAANSSILGGDPCNVWWRLVSSGTLFPGTHFIGNILASTSLHLQTGAVLNGRAFAQTANVTLDSNTITGPVCGVRAIPSATPSSTPTVTPTGPTPTQTPSPTFTPTVPTPTQTRTATPTLTKVAPPQNTQVPPATATPLPAPTETTSPTAPAIVGLPQTGGGPLPGTEFPWSQMLVLGGLAAVALGLGVGAYRRRAQRPPS